MEQLFTHKDEEQAKRTHVQEQLFTVGERGMMVNGRREREDAANPTLTAERATR